MTEDLSPISRRDVVVGGAALAAAATLPMPAFAQAKAARYRRLNVSSPAAAKTMDSYKKAIRAMLALSPSDPRNWYRHALIHTMDCPHGNWWFVVWHRGYLGWFEQTCRDLSGDPDFAFPYWDWTADPRVPAMMFDDVLNPNHPAYIQSLDRFNAEFTPVLETMWKGFSDAQIQQLLIRGLRFPADLLFDINPNPGGPMFYAPPNSRGSTPQRPGFDQITSDAVSSWMLQAALGPIDFQGFGSPKTRFHGNLTGFGVMEGQPHNKVHNCVGGIWTENGQTTYGDGFMQANMSPVDPIFFLHHSNIDRLWDVWTRKQQGYGLPTLPSDVPGFMNSKSDLELWQSEPFLFFTDAKGRPLPADQLKAGAYQTIGQFDYDYEPGSGEDVVPKRPMLRTNVAPRQFYATELKKPGTASLGVALAKVSPALLAKAAQPGGPSLVASVTLDLPPFGHDQQIGVVVNTPEGSAAGADSPGFVTTLSMFGHHIMHGPVTFDVPLSHALGKLSKANKLGAAQGLTVRVVQLNPHGQMSPHAMLGAGAVSDNSVQVVDVKVHSN